MVIPWLPENAGPYVQATSATPMAPLFDDYECMGEEHLNNNTPLPQSAMTNNGKYWCLIILFRWPIYHIISHRSMVILWLTEIAVPYVRATSGTPMAPLFDNYECMAEEHLNDNTPLPPSVLTNNGKYWCLVIPFRWPILYIILYLTQPWSLHDYQKGHDLALSLHQMHRWHHYLMIVVIYTIL